jgi:hypothetical protein
VTKLLTKVVCTIDDVSMPMSDWRASSTINGGYDTFSCNIPARQALSSHVGQGAPVRLFLESGRVVWEGKLGVDPKIQDERAFITATGPKLIAERSIGRRLYQAFGTSLWAPDSGSPFNGTPSQSIHAQAEPGALHWTANQGETVANGDSTALVCWIPGVKIRRIRGIPQTRGSTTGYILNLYKADGPAGTRTIVGTNSFTPLDITISAPLDMIVVALARSGATHTRTDSLDVVLRDLRINDLTLADALTATQVASDLGRRLGLDVAGIPTGPATDTITGSVFVQYFGPMTTGHTDDGVSGLETTEPVEPFLYQVETPAVAGSALNVLPLDHQGSDAALLDQLTFMLDWRWRIGANVAGVGNKLEFGPWGPEWDISLQAGAQADLAPQEKFNWVTIPYTNAAGKPVQYRKKADPDPLARYGDVRVYEEALQSVQKDDRIARAMADLLLTRVTKRRYAGRLQVAFARAADGRQSTYEIQAGELARIGDWGPNDAQTLRISQVEMSAEGVSLGVDGEPVSLDHLQALMARRNERKPLGHIDIAIRNKV